MSTNFDKARNAVISHLDTAIGLCKQLHTWYPQAGFDEHVRSFDGIKSKLQGAVKPCLTAAELAKAESLKRHLANHPDFKSKFIQFVMITDLMAKGVVFDHTLTYDVNEVISDLDRYTSAGWITNEVIREMRAEPRGIRSILAIMQLLASRKETFYHSVMSRTAKATETLHLAGFDLKDIFSLGSKVPRNEDFETDVNTIRICIAHSLYVITKKGDEYNIHFETHQKGFNYVKDFTAKQFLKFFFDYLLFERVTSMLLAISLNQAMMRKYLMR